MILSENPSSIQLQSSTMENVLSDFKFIEFRVSV